MRMAVRILAAVTALVLALSGVPGVGAAAESAYTGQLIDVEQGYIVFSTGDALRLAPDAQFVYAATGKPYTARIQPGDYAAATLDDKGAVALVRISDMPIGEGTPITQVPRQFVVQASAPQPNPDLASKPTQYPPSKLSPLEQVSITVEVPPQTPFADDVYIATDTSGWNPQAVKMQRIDGRHFRMSMLVSPGTEFRYLFTRGSWATVESDPAGLRRTPRTLKAEGGAALAVDATVRRWIDLP